MANIMLGFPNIFDLGNLSGGIWTPGLPLSHLQFRQIGRVARTENASEAASQVVLDYLTPRPVRLISLINHNISFGGQIIYEAANDIDFTDLVYQETADAWAAIGGAEWVLDELEWEADNFWNGTFSLDEVEGLTSLAFHVLPVDISARYWRIRIKDSANDAGYIQIGRVFMGLAWSPQINMSYGASFGYEDPTSVETAIGGAEYFDQREPYRVLRFTLAHLREATEGFAKVLEIIRRAGVHGEILVIPDPADFENAQRRNFLGRLRQLSALEHAYFDTMSAAFELKEIK